MGTDIINTVIINEETYLIRKFDALTGMQLIRMLSAKIMPQFNKLSTAKDEDALELIGSMMAALTDEDVETLMKYCLRVCSKVLPAGPAYIMDRAGNYGVEGVEYDMPLVFRLCFEALKWGLGDFFAGNNSIFSSLPSLAGSR